MNELLKIENFSVSYKRNGTFLKALDEINFSIKNNEVLGLVGESGSGKSTIALSIMRLLPIDAAKIEQGKIYFKDKDILSLYEKEMRKIRGREIGLILQDSMSSLDPLWTIGFQIREAIGAHKKVSRKEKLEKSIELLKLVGISDAEKRLKSYPHELSGGMRQRVLIAMAISNNPSLVIADEPTSALDVTLQIQILKLMQDLKEKLKISILLISHDLSVISQIAGKVIVMYAGRIMEIGNVIEVYKKPLHPYTKALLSSFPDEKKRVHRLEFIKGSLPDLTKSINYCVFYPRCGFRKQRCRDEKPNLQVILKERECSCFYPLD